MFRRKPTSVCRRLPHRRVLFRPSSSEAEFHHYSKPAQNRLSTNDRDDLDGQIYRNFLHTSTVTKAEAAQPKNSEEMRKFLGQNKRLVFTLIQKFRWDKGKDYPLLSPRNDIIVIVDEAHRTDVLVTTSSATLIRNRWRIYLGMWNGLK
jgi:SWI2/SNF2 ATPase